MTAIMGKSVATAEQLAAYLLSVNPSPKFSRNITAVEFCQLYIIIGDKEGVRGDLGCVQCFKETGNLKYGGDVKYTQNNFAGIGATGGVPGNTFPDIETGILAHIQHLKSYATKAPLNEPNVDPRRTNWFMNVKGGTSPNIETLGGTWAVPGYSTAKYASLEAANNAKDSYGYQIVNILNKVLKINVKKEETKMAYKLAVDAGHGSNTAGKRTPDGYREHWVNVKCANYFEIGAKRCGFETVRIAWDDTNATDDADIALATRQKMIAAEECDASVSWHANAHGNGQEYTTGQGIETLIHSYNARVGDSLALANSVQSYLIKGTEQKNRGVKRSNLAMCNCTSLGVKAAILIEVGFMTNEYEKELIKTDAFCFECAEEAVQGFCKYFGVPYVAPTTTVAKPKPVSTTTYVVQSGDTLSKIGKAKNIPWKSIADLNGINAPYILKVGQTLKLPTVGTNVKENAVVIPYKITQSKTAIQEFLNEYYSTEIKKVLGAKLVVDGAIGTKTKLALGVAFQVELNKLGGKLTVDGKIGPASDAAFDKLVGTLKKGMKNSLFVTLWQCILVAHNLNPNGIDGNFGSGCVAATNTLFGKIGLVKDSTVSGADLNALL